MLQVQQQLALQAVELLELQKMQAVELLELQKRQAVE
jgi:hypothetical protein